MGNNQSSSSSQSSSYSIKKKRDKHHGLEKSASFGSAFSTTSSSEEDPANPSSARGPTPQNAEDATDKKTSPNSFHYNIHQPEDLLKQENKKTLQVKRHSSALEFVSGKSPLRDYLRDKFTRGNGNNANNNKGTVMSNQGTMNPTAASNSHLDKLAKILVEISQSQEGTKPGQISEPVLKRHLIPHSSKLGDYLWTYFTQGDEKQSTISDAILISTAEKIYALHTDKDQLNFYLKIFSSNKDMLQIHAFADFLSCAYHLSVLSEGGVLIGLEPVEPLDNENDSDKAYLDSVVKSCYHIKNEMSICFLVNWLLTNLPRIHQLMHKYILHQLTTGYAQLSSGNVTIHTQGGGVQLEVPNGKGDPDDLPPLPLSPSECRKMEKVNGFLMWLLKCSLTPKFLGVFNKKQEQPSNRLRAVSSAQLLLQLMHNKLEPESWSMLYDSETDGLSINRFQFHVFNYRGPTLMIIYAENGYTLALAVDTEWKESCHFWGEQEATLLQLQPEFRVVERGVKLIYVNFSIRGYPFGIQVGKDPKNVSLEVKPDFGYASYKKIPCRVLKVVVWGCAPKQTQTAQTEYKKWEAKQCENIRKVNINSAEWKDNPDKYLLELAGNYRSYDHS